MSLNGQKHSLVTLFGVWKIPDFTTKINWAELAVSYLDGIYQLLFKSYHPLSVSSLDLVVALTCLNFWRWFHTWWNSWTLFLCPSIRSTYTMPWAWPYRPPVCRLIIKLSLSGSRYLPQLDPLAAADEQARPPALPQEPDDEEDPEGAPCLLWLQVTAGQGPGHGGGQPQGQRCLQLHKVSYHLQSSLTKIPYFGNSNRKSFSKVLNWQARGQGPKKGIGEFGLGAVPKFL